MCQESPQVTLAGGRSASSPKPKGPNFASRSFVMCTWCSYIQSRLWHTPALGRGGPGVVLQVRWGHSSLPGSPTYHTDQPLAFTLTTSGQRL